MLLRTHTAKKMFDPFIYSLVRIHPSCRHIIHCRCMIDECIIAEWCCWCVCVCVCVCVWLCLAVPKAFHVLVAGHLEVSGWSAGRVEALIECLGTHHWTWGHGQRTLSISTKTMLPFPVNVKALFVLAHSLCVCVYVCVCAQVLWMAGWRSFYQWVSARPSTLPVFDVKTNGTANLLLCVLW